MHKFRILPAAAADLDGITDYTRREHGERQCAVYLGELAACFARLREVPVLECHRDAIRPGLKSRKQGHHVIFYLHDGADVVIVRVLHEQMDHEHHDFREGDQ